MAEVIATNTVKTTVEQKSFCRQTKILTKKNLLVQFRNKGATAAQLLVGVLFIILLLIMDIAVKENNKSNAWYINTRNPSAYNAFAFTPCTGANGGKCYSMFVYGDSEAEATLGSNVASLIGIPGENKPSGWNFVNKSKYPQLKDYLFDNMNISRIGVEFKWRGGRGSGPSYANGENEQLPASYILHYNKTRNCGDLGVFNCENTQQELLVPLMTAIDSVILRHYATDDYVGTKKTARIQASFKDFPHPALSIALDVVERFGANFFFMAVAFNFIVQLRNLVSEKQNKLRDAMKQIGMLDSAYWTSWLISCVITNTLSTLLLIIMGAIAQFPFFLSNDFLTYFLHFWITMFAFTCSGFFLSSLVNNEQTAINIGLGLFILFFLAGSILATIFYSGGLTNDYSYDLYRTLFMAVPGAAAPFGFFQGFGALVTTSSALGAAGMRIGEIGNNVLPSKIMEDGSVATPYWSIRLTWIWMLGNGAYCLLLAWYFDNALQNSYGRSEGWFFCLKKSFWCAGKTSTTGTEGPRAANMKEDRSALTKHINADMEPLVRDEANRIIGQ